MVSFQAHDPPERPKCSHVVTFSLKPDWGILFYFFRIYWNIQMYICAGILAIPCKY